MTAQMLSAVALEAGKRGLANIVTSLGTAERLPFADRSFDMVVSRYSAHHWRDFAAGVAEASRVLQPEGTAVFIDVATPRHALLDTFLQSVEMLRDPSHVRDRSLAEWTDQLTRVGLEPESLWRSRLRLEFSSWIGRMATPEPFVAAIRALQSLMPEEVRSHFGIEPDGSFTVDVLTIQARPAA
jgi:SAM-dependent methyltransferase